MEAVNTFHAFHVPEAQDLHFCSSVGSRCFLWSTSRVWQLNLCNIKSCLSNVHALLCLKSKNSKLIMSDLPFLESHLTRKISYLIGKQIHSHHDSDCSRAYTHMKRFNHPKHLILSTSIFNRMHFFCHTFTHDLCWSWGIEGVEWIKSLLPQDV